MKICIIENDQKIRELLKIMFELAGHYTLLVSPTIDVLTGGGGEVAAELELAVIDHDFVNVTALSLLQAQYPELPILLLTSDSFATERIIVGRVVAKALQKPFKVTSLIKAIESATSAR